MVLTIRQGSRLRLWHISSVLYFAAWCPCPHLFFSESYDSFFLVWIHLGEQIGPLGCAPQGLIVDLVEFGSRQHSVGMHPDKSGDVLRNQFVVL